MKWLPILLISLFFSISVFAQVKPEEFGGVGIRFRTDFNTGYAIVADVVPRSPAQNIGIKKDDLILEIDGKSTLDLSSEEIKNLIRGKIGTGVVLKMQRGQKIRDFTLKRVKIVMQEPK